MTVSEDDTMCFGSILHVDNDSEGYIEHLNLFLDWVILQCTAYIMDNLGHPYL